MRRVALALLATVLVLAGCDDGSPDTAASQDTTSTILSPGDATSSTVSPEEATPTTVSPDAPAASSDADPSNPADERFCTLARAYFEYMTRRGPGDVR